MASFLWPFEHAAFRNVEPVDIIARLPNPQEWMWLDHAVTSHNSAAWSYLGCNPKNRIEIHTGHTVIFERGESKHTITLGKLGGMAALKQSIETSILQKNEAVLPLDCDQNPPPFWGGWVGFLSYSLAEENPSVFTIDNTFPQAIISFFDLVLAYNHPEKQWWAVAIDTSPVAARNKLSTLLEQITTHPLDAHQNTPHEKNSITSVAKTRCQSNFTRQQYEDRVRKVLDYITAGDIYQVNVAQRLRSHWEGDEVELYLRLRSESPAEFGAFLPSGILGEGRALLSISPELFLRVRGRNVITRPIKGTRPLANSQALTDQAAQELSVSLKERAELNMIVDLERNDLGRVCDYGSVRVENAGEIQTLPTLLHRVATVCGRLRSDVGITELLHATFPGGSITGAPKIRAMQIIDELETVPRGPYCGAIGWIGINGDMDFSIAIRTALLNKKTQTVDYHAGSGIVADSDPASEYEETLHKSRSFFRALNTSLSVGDECLGKQE